MDIKECINKRFLIKYKPDPELSQKEFNEAEYDLEQARKSFEDEDYKWSIVKCYYSMFHAAKAILYRLGYIEKKHIAVIIVLEELNKQGKIESRFINDFKAAVTAREDADYHYSYSKEIAEIELQNSSDFIEMTARFLKKN
jgi:uncharacterized protein (UPF0332 family)